jgi:hypothetical protein
MNEAKVGHGAKQCGSYRLHLVEIKAAFTAVENFDEITNCSKAWEGVAEINSQKLWWRRFHYPVNAVQPI